MSIALKPLIPSWLDDAGLTPAEFRVLSHLIRRANKNGIAYPSYKSMSEIVGMSQATIRRAIEKLKVRELIAISGKPFAGSCRYKVLPILAPEILLDAANSCTRDTIDTTNTCTRDTIDELPESPQIANTISPAIVAPRPSNTIRDASPIVAPEIEEGYTLKGIQLRESKPPSPKSHSTEAIQLSMLFKSSLPQDYNPSSNWKTSWPKEFQKLIDKGKDPDEIRKIVCFGRTDGFWKDKILSPAKFNSTKDGVNFYERMKVEMKSANPSFIPDTRNRKSEIEEI